MAEQEVSKSSPKQARKRLGQVIRNNPLKTQGSDEKACNNLETYSRISTKSQ